MTVCLSLFIAINQLTILSSVAVAGGLYFFFVGFHLLARKRLLLSTPTSKIRSAAMGLVEVNGAAVGPYTMAAPITGKPCFLYHTTAWRQRDGKKQEWEKVADETLHVPFFIDDSTGQLLIEPLGADLDLHRDFREEYASSFFSNSDDIPPRVSVFLSRHGIATGHRLRIEERSIKSKDALFVAGTLTENPGVQVRAFAPRGDSAPSNGGGLHPPAPNEFSQPSPAPRVIQLSSGAAPSTTQEMTQQAKIAAALNRAGITKPEAWSVAGVPYQPMPAEENVVLTRVSGREEPRSHDMRPLDPSAPDLSTREEQPKSPDFNVNPPVVLMKGANDPTFVISFRSQKEFVSALAWKSAAMVWGGAAITVLGIYMLLLQMELL